MVPNTTRPFSIAILAGSLCVSRAPAQGIRSGKLPPDSILGRSVPISLHASAPALSLGADVTTITAEDIAASGASSLAELLTARVAGLSVTRSGGTSAHASQIQIRAPVSLFFTTHPLIVIDGVPTRFPQLRSGLFAVGTSTLDDFAIDEIARVDVLRGPAAAALFGPGAASGVIAITTTRASGGAFRVRARVESGVISDRTDYPANYAMTGTIPGTSQVASRCRIIDQAEGRCTATRLDQWNPLEQASPFRTGLETGSAAWAAGDLARTAIALGATSRTTRGVTPDDEVTRSGAHLDLARPIGRIASIGATMTYDRAWAALPDRGDSYDRSDPITTGLFGFATDGPGRGYLQGLPTFENPASEGVEHVGASSRASWQPRPWLMLTATGGRERSVARRHSKLISIVTSTGQPVPGGSGRTFSQFQSGNVGVGAEASTMWRGVGLRSVLGYDEQRTRLVDEDAYGMDSSLITASSLQVRQHYRAITFQERASWGGVLFVNAGASWQADGIIKALGKAPFNQVDVSWLPGRVLGVQGIRVRAARGVAAADGPDLPQLSLDLFTFAPPEVHALERTQETNFGLDAPLGRGALSLTYYHTLTRHGFLEVPVAASVGYTTRLAQGATLRSNGLEVTASQQLISSRFIDWHVALSLATIRNRLLRMAYPPFFANDYSILEEGYDPNGVWSRSLSYRDANSDGMIDSSEVQVSGGGFSGTSAPTFEGSLRSRLSRGHWSLGIVLDHRGGFVVVNRTEMSRCRVGICRGMQDPSAPLSEQARAVSTAKPEFGWFVENGSFVRLSEASLRWGPGPGSVRSRPQDRLAISLIARDAALWTRYSGLDPELASAGAVGQSPIPVRLSLRVELGAPLP